MAVTREQAGAMIVHGRVIGEADGLAYAVKVVDHALSSYTEQGHVALAAIDDPETAWRYALSARPVLDGVELLRDRMQALADSHQHRADSAAKAAAKLMVQLEQTTESSLASAVARAARVWRQ